MTKAIFNSLDATCRAPLGAVEQGTPVRLTLRVPTELSCTTPHVLFRRDGEQPSLLALAPEGEQDGVALFTITLTPERAGLYFYHFDLYVNYQKLYRGALGESYITTGEGEAWQLTVYEKGFQTPEILRGGVMYQIFPDRFFEGVPNKPMPFPERVYRDDKDGEPYFWPTESPDGHLNMDYYGGDLVGIQQKLPYLAQLGVTLLYLNPIFEAHANHRYNTADYLNVDPLLGTNEDFTALCKAATGYGIRVILDGVFSHTGSDSRYFNREGRYPDCGAYQGEQSPYRSWYDFSPNYACGYRSWWGFDSLPEVNENDPAYRAFICGKNGVIDTWMKRGAAGFRLDVADELPDDFIEEIRRAVKRHGEDKYLLGEVWEDATTKWSYGSRRTYLLGKGLDAVMNYPFREAILQFMRGRGARDTADAILRVCENYPAPALHVLMNFMSTHDTERAITALAGDSCDGRDRYWQSGRRLDDVRYAHGRALMRLAYAMLYTLPGLPCIYYGDEICMQGYKDPFNRAFFDWDSTENTVRPVLQKLAELRRNCPALEQGTLHMRKAAGGVLVYERTDGAHTVAVCINRGETEATETLLGRIYTVKPFDFALAWE